jgi:hypothetical protein
VTGAKFATISSKRRSPLAGSIVLRCGGLVSKVCSPS